MEGGEGHSLGAPAFPNTAGKFASFFGFFAGGGLPGSGVLGVWGWDLVGDACRTCCGDGERSVRFCGAFLGAMVAAPCCQPQSQLGCHRGAGLLVQAACACAQQQCYTLLPAAAQDASCESSTAPSAFIALPLASQMS